MFYRRGFEGGDGDWERNAWLVSNLSRFKLPLRMLASSEKRFRKKKSTVLHLIHLYIYTLTTVEETETRYHLGSLTTSSIVSTSCCRVVLL